MSTGGKREKRSMTSGDVKVIMESTRITVRLDFFAKEEIESSLTKGDDFTKKTI